MKYYRIQFDGDMCVVAANDEADARAVAWRDQWDPGEGYRYGDGPHSLTVHEVDGSMLIADDDEARTPRSLSELSGGRTGLLGSTML